MWHWEVGSGWGGGVAIGWTTFGTWEICGALDRETGLGSGYMWVVLVSIEVKHFTCQLDLGVWLWVCAGGACKVSVGYCGRGGLGGRRWYFTIGQSVVGVVEMGSN